MYLIGITGSIGSGKTTLANIARELGYVVYDVDEWVRFIYKDGDFLELLEKNFTGSVKNGVADKRYLREIVFNDKKKLAKLESLIYPILNAKIRKLITKGAKNNFIVFLDIALLFEKKWDKYCDFIILADADYELRKKRVMLRDKVSAQNFASIDNVQMSNDEKKDKVDIVINTDKPISVLKAEMINLLNSINGE
ncbi:MAG: dephospho-CoA kinase [Alphaproteobacteria bacterium]|nr:dephospho-CoA kinase [Alphaproteobacteria bacterium]